MQRHDIAALLLCLSTLGCAVLPTERARGDASLNGPSEDPALQRAAEKAQATLDDFLIKASRPPAGTSAYALKVKVQEGGHTEYFWVEEFTWVDASFTGKINNEPRVVKGVQFGQTYKFDRSQIADWKYFDEKTGKTVGNFSASS